MHIGQPWIRTQTAAGTHSDDKSKDVDDDGGGGGGGGDGDGGSGACDGGVAGQTLGQCVKISPTESCIGIKVGATVTS